MFLTVKPESAGYFTKDTECRLEEISGLSPYDLWWFVEYGIKRALDVITSAVHLDELHYSHRVIHSGGVKQGKFY